MITPRARKDAARFNGANRAEYLTKREHIAALLMAGICSQRGLADADMAIGGAVELADKLLIALEGTPAP